MGSLLGSIFANSFLCYHEDRWLNTRPEEFRPVFYKRYVDNIFIIFRKEEQLNFFKLLEIVPRKYKIYSEKETNNKLSFPDIEVLREKLSLSL